MLSTKNWSHPKRLKHCNRKDLSAVNKMLVLLLFTLNYKTAIIKLHKNKKQVVERASVSKINSWPVICPLVFRFHETNLSTIWHQSKGPDQQNLNFGMNFSFEPSKTGLFSWEV